MCTGLHSERPSSYLCHMMVLKTKIKRLISYQCADSHADNGALQKGQGVLGATGLCPTKGPASIAPRVHKAKAKEVFLSWISLDN